MSKIAFLPFNVSETTRPALGRQVSWFASELIKDRPGAEVSFGNFMIEVGTQEDPRSAMASLSNSLNQNEFVWDLLRQVDGEFAVDGLVTENEGSLDVTVRVFEGPGADPATAEQTFSNGNIFDVLRFVLGEVSKSTRMEGADEWVTGLEFGTSDASAFKRFLIGYDAVAYVQAAGGRVAKEFDVSLAFDELIGAYEQDRDFLGPYEAALHLARLCAENGVGSFEIIEPQLQKLLQLEQEDWRGFYTLGQIYLAGGRFDKATEMLEKAVLKLDMERARAEKEGDAPPVAEPALFNQLALAQQGLGMAVNAERNFRKAIELEGDDKPSLDYLANLLTQTGRGIEVPSLYEGYTRTHPENAAFWTKYAIALAQNGKADDAKKVFETGLEKTNGAPGMKRFYAAFLQQRGDLHEAMDFYEEYLETAPEDAVALWEYTQTLDRAERFVEVPDSLKKLLALEIPPQVRALAVARMYELEQPKRMEALQRAQQNANDGKIDAAIADLEALTQWTQDYFKAWYMLAALYNRTGKFVEAEEACKNLLNLYPGFEAGLNELANAMIGQEKMEDAYKFLSMAAQANPQSLPLHLQLAMVAKQTGRREQAVQIARGIREAVGTENPSIEQALAEIERA